MAFVAQARPVVSYPIKANFYDEKGKLKSISFVAQYKRLPQEKLVELNDSMVNHNRKIQGLDPLRLPEGGEPVAWPYKSDVAFIQDHMVGWLEVADPDGEKKPFDLDSLNEILSAYPELVQPLFQGVFRSHQGAREKN